MVHKPTVSQTVTTDVDSGIVFDRLNPNDTAEIEANTTFNFTMTGNINFSPVDEGGYWLLRARNLAYALGSFEDKFLAYNSNVSFTNVDPNNIGVDVQVQLTPIKYSNEALRNEVINTQTFDAGFVDDYGTTVVYDFNFIDPDANAAFDVNTAIANADLTTANTQQIIVQISGSTDAGLAEYIKLATNAKTVANALKQFGEGSAGETAADDMMDALLDLLDVYIESNDKLKQAGDDYETLSDFVIDQYDAGNIPKRELYKKATDPVTGDPIVISVFQDFESRIQNAAANTASAFEDTVTELAEELYKVTLVLEKGSVVVTARYYTNADTDTGFAGNDVFDRINRAKPGRNATIDAIQQYDNNSLPAYLEADAVSATNDVINLTRSKITFISSYGDDILRDINAASDKLEVILRKYNITPPVSVQEE